MKVFFRLLSSIGVMALCVATPLTAQSQVIFETYFGTAEGYVDGPLAGQPQGADMLWIDGDPDANPAASFNVVDGDLHVTNVGPGSKWVYINIPTQSGQFTAEWTWQFVGEEEGNADVGICFSDSENFNLDGNPAPTWNEQGAMMRMFTNGTIDVADGNWDGGVTYRALNELNYQDGKRIHIRMEVDAHSWLFDVYALVDGESDEIPLAEGWGFRRLTSPQTDGLNALALWDTGPAPGLGMSVVIENFRIYGVTEVDYWMVH